MIELTIDAEVRRKVRALGKAPFGTLTEEADPRRFHVALNAFNRARLQPTVCGADWESDLKAMHDASVAEARFVEDERRKIFTQASSAPAEPRAFADWFEALQHAGPGQFDAYFDYLAEKATLAELRWFVKQEYCGEIGFDDLIALTQIRLPARAKMELARNYWDEMGGGELTEMHGPMYVAMAHALGVKNTPEDELVWETLALANLLTALACNSRYAWHSLGALSIIELTSPPRAARVAAGLERLGLPEHASRYFRLHSTVDVGHWNAIREEVILPVVKAAPEVAVALAEGALLRLNAGARLVRRYRKELPPGSLPARARESAAP